MDSSRERDPADRCRHLLTLTPAGKTHLASTARAQKDTEDALFASLDHDQREQLRTARASRRTRPRPRKRLHHRCRARTMKLTTFGAQTGNGRAGRTRWWRWLWGEEGRRRQVHIRRELNPLRGAIRLELSAVVVEARVLALGALLGRGLCPGRQCATSPGVASGARSHEVALVVVVVAP
jgi:hypothetical protein